MYVNVSNIINIIASLRSAHNSTLISVNQKIFATEKNYFMFPNFSNCLV